MGTALFELACFVLFICTVSCEPCGEDPFWLNVTREPQVLKSPGWDQGSYPANSYCIYNYNVPDGKYAMVTFTHFDMEGDMNCKKDYLELTLNGMGARSIRYCADGLPKKTFLFSEFYPQMLFRTDNSNQGHGFQLLYQLVDTDQICGDDEIECGNKNCVKKSGACNGQDECGDGTDEENCDQNVEEFQCGKPKVGSVEQTRMRRVIGGQESLPGSWPWQVSLQHHDIYPSGHQCGGVLINRQWVLTAAHCISRYLELRIKLGNHRQLKEDNQQQIRYAAAKFSHPFFNPLILENDIGLIKLNAPIAVTDTVQPICLPELHATPEDGTACYATGWGRNSTTNIDNIPNLHEVKVPLVNHEECEAIYQRQRKFVPDLTVCTGYEHGGQNPCYGDSGGPLVTEENGKWTLVGVVSFGSKQCGDPEPTVYTSVSRYMNWIKDTMRDA